MEKLKIRKASESDAELILGFIRELARYEKAENEVKATAGTIRESLFSKQASAHSLICLSGDKPIGFAVYFFNYSTWLGRNGLYIEDLYITPESRGKGAGKFIMKHLAQLALSKGCGRMEWSVLDWNEPAIRVYDSTGAKPQNEWILYRLAGEDLKSFAGA